MDYVIRVGVLFHDHGGGLVKRGEGRGRGCNHVIYLQLLVQPHDQQWDAGRLLVHPLHPLDH